MARFLSDCVYVELPHVDARDEKRLSDYVLVPRMAMRGEWALSYMLPDEQLVHLAVMANHLPARKAKSQRSAYNERFNAKHAAKVAADKAAKRHKR